MSYHCQVAVRTTSSAKRTLERSEDIVQTICDKFTIIQTRRALLRSRHLRRKRLSSHPPVTWRSLFDINNIPSNHRNKTFVPSAQSQWPLAFEKACGIYFSSTNFVAKIAYCLCVIVCTQRYSQSKFEISAQTAWPTQPQNMLRLNKTRRGDLQRYPDQLP